MVAFIRIVLSFLLAAMAFDGTKMSALGLDASRVGRNAHSNQVETDNHPPKFPTANIGHENEAPINAGVDAADKYGPSWFGRRWECVF